MEILHKQIGLIVATILVLYGQIGLLIPTNLYAQPGGGGSGTNITSESQHPLRHRANRTLTDTTNFNNNLSSSDDNIQDALDTIDNLTITGAPTNADYLVGTANGSLSAEIVVGTSPGGELGNTWASPTVDSTHAGSAHHASFLSTDIDTSAEILAIVGDETGSGLLTFATSPVLTTPDINAGTADGLTSLGIRSTGTGAFDLVFANTENLTVGAKTLTLTLNNANRVLTISGDATVSGTNTGDNTVATSGDSATSFFSTGTLEVAIGGTGTTTSTGTGAVVLGTSPTFTTDITFPALSIEAGAYGAATIDGDDIASGIAGRSLTLTAATPDTLDVDNELFNHIATIILESPAVGDDAKIQLKFATAITITRVSASTDVGTCDIQFDERAEGTPNTAGTDVMTAALQATTSTANTTSFTNATIAADAPLSLDIDAVASSPTVVRIHVEYTIDD